MQLLQCFIRKLIRIAINHSGRTLRANIKQYRFQRATRNSISHPSFRYKDFSEHKNLPICPLPTHSISFRRFAFLAWITGLYFNLKFIPVWDRGGKEHFDLLGCELTSLFMLAASFLLHNYRFTTGSVTDATITSSLAHLTAIGRRT